MTLQPIALVVQRFGPDIRGGAEQHAARLAALLLRRYPVEILTTTAVDYRYWQEGFPAGSSPWPGPSPSTLPSSLPKQGEAKATLRRFSVQGRRWPLLFSAYNRLMIAATKLGLPRRLRWPLERLWYRLQGPYCPELVDFLATEQHRYREVIFITYLYYPAVMAAAQLSVPYRLIPTLHDEPAKDFLHTRRLLAGAKTLIVNSPAEQQLIAGLDNAWPAKSTIIGIHLPGVYFAGPLACPEKGEPYLLYVGRIDAGKGLGPLLAWVAAAAFSRPVTLKLAGHDQGTVVVPEGVAMLGEVSDEEKRELMAGALAVVHPSTLESLALVALEAMALGTPVLLHDGNAVFRRYTAAVASARGFYDQPSFYAAVEALLAAPPSTEVREKGRAWVREHFGEAAIEAKFTALFAG